MMRIGVLSDTHGFLHPRVFDFFIDCNEIWHAGDIGSSTVTDKLASLKPLRAVFGNIDGHELRLSYPETALFQCENVKVMITHIAGYPGKYARGISNTIKSEKPDILVAGHSHLLKVMHDSKNKLLFINPGAAGNQGFHQKITFLRFCITLDRIHDLEIMEIDRNQRLSQPVG